MAARYVGTVEDDESQQTRARYNKKTSRASATVSFQAKPSVISFNDAPQDFEESEQTGEGEDGEGVIHSREAWWRFLIENKRAQQVFRVFDLLNLVVLAMSVPLGSKEPYSLGSIQDLTPNCTDPDHVLRDSFMIQFTLITVLDFILALVFTVSLIVQLAYALCLMGSTEAEQKGLFRYTYWIGISLTILVTLSLWWSVGIGIHRSISVCIGGRFYWGSVPRAVSIIGVIQLFVPIPIKWNSLPLSELLTLFKLKQLAFVTMFYFIFVFLLALIGVHLIGSLDYFCVFTNESGEQFLAIPVTHCFPGSNLCPLNSTVANVSCVRYNFTAQPSDDYNLNYRSLVYYGQFRVILDGLFAVYEASTLELWSYMMYNAITGHSMAMAIIFYVLLISFLVILLQQSLFLVVIIEAFSALRSETSSESGDEEKQTKNKQLTVLRSNSDNKLYLHSKEGKTYSDFLGKYSKVLQIIEKFFLSLVFIDAIMIASKTDDVNCTQRYILQGWQVFVSVAFFVEVLVIFVFHVICCQVKGFLLRPYYWCLIVLAVGGLVACIPHEQFYYPSMPANGLAIFQTLRLPRLIRSFKPLREFFSKIMGNKRIVVLSVITIVAISWLTVVNMQIFGYLDPDPECQRVGGGHFDNIWEAFQSTFQLVLNEAWTDLTSEVMCRNSGWIAMNIYFIAIHLFSSLIFLNFFGAVILDNLEYDDDEKQKKLEELQEPKKKTVPWHLKIFKYNKPKHVRPPIDTGFEAPNIEEVELKRFFESGGGQLSGDHKEYAAPHPLLTQPSQTAVPHASQLQRRQSELSSLGLVSSDNSEFTAETPALHGKYNSITAILNYAKVYRQASEDKRTKQTKDSFERAFSTQSDTSLLLESEYNEFRERHRYFDMALFCMPPEHKLRRFCSFLLAAQCRPPTPVGKANNIASRVALNVKYYFQMVVSMLPYVTWIMLVFVMSLLVVHIEEYDSTSGFKYYIPIEVLYVVVMLSWLLLKVLANGFILNPNAAIKSLWDVLDWIIVLDCIVVLVGSTIWITIWGQREEPIGAVLSSPTLIDRGWASVFLAIRVIRPLHAISIVPAFRSVVRELVEGWRNLLLGALILFLFLFMFASLGVQLFAGTNENDPQAFCNDPTITTQGECVGEFVMKLKTSREFLATDVNNNEILVPRVWFQVARDYRFDNVGSSFLTLFYLLTLEGWLECRDLFDSRNTTLAQSADLYMSFYMHTYVFLAVNMVLQLLLGIVVNNFNEHKAGHSFLLSVQQSRWSELLQRIALQRPYKLPKEPSSKARLLLYRFLIHHHYRILPTIIHSLNTLTLVVPWDTVHTKMPGIVACICLSIFFNSYSLVELTLKLIAFGPKGYFQSWRNIFDVLLALYSIVYIVFAVVLLSLGLKVENNTTYLEALILTALILAVLKAITVLIKYSAMLNLLITILNTLIKSIPLIFVVSIILICYSLVGVVLFSNVRSGEAINYDLVNFRTSSNSMITMLRSMTGEDWYQIMWDLAVDRPHCTDRDCGNLVLSVLYFSSFTLLVPLILINVFIGVLLEKFSLFYNDDDTKLNYSAIKDFKRKWSVFDNKASGHIPAGRLKLLLRTLDQQQYHTFCLKDGVRERRPFWLIEHHLLLWEMAEELQREVTVQTRAAEPGGRSTGTAHHHSFQSVLRMLAYRVEDINVRLEPQDLYAREDHENNIQVDVAEQCILKWLKNYVEPLVKKQQREAEESTPEISSRRPHAGDRSKLLSMHNMRSQLLDVSAYHQPSFETEDEQDTLPHRHSMYTSPVPSEDYYDGEEKENPVLAYSYERLAKNAGGGQETEQWARDWLQLQQEWMERIGEDENYFDDQL